MSNVLLTSVQVRKSSVEVGGTVHIGAVALNLDMPGNISGLCRIVPDRPLDEIVSTTAQILGGAIVPLQMYFDMENRTYTFKVMLQEQDAADVWQTRFMWSAEFTITPVPSYSITPGLAVAALVAVGLVVAYTVTRGK